MIKTYVDPMDMLNLLSSSNPQPIQQIAALDLGSNSFHLIIARWQNGQIHVIDRIKESVRLGWGLSADGQLDEAAKERALACLARFGERLRTFPIGNVRVAGTKTLRSVKHSDKFLAKAQQLLGHPVEIISGSEEARIIYLGVACDLAPVEGRRLVVDIGGGSTEVIIGQGMEPELKESLSMGCVAITKRFFSKGKVTAGRIKKARTACMQELAPILDALSETSWSEEIGASGTIRAASNVCKAQGFSENGMIKLKYLEKILEQYLDSGHVEHPIDGLSENRYSVFLGGLIILITLFEGLKLKSMTAAQWALREGLLYDLKGRLEHSDLRENSIINLANRFHVNYEYAQRVDHTAQLMLKQSKNWFADPVDTKQLLHWSAMLFLLGLDISHSDYHKHGAYMVEHVDLAGFSRSEQQELAWLVLGHRKSIRKNFPIEHESLLKILFLLRIAVLIQRGRRQQVTPEFQCRAEDKTITLGFYQQWLDNNPQTEADLYSEQRYMAQVGYQLELITLMDE